MVHRNSHRETSTAIAWAPASTRSTKPRLMDITSRITMCLNHKVERTRNAENPRTPGTLPQPSRNLTRNVRGIHQRSAPARRAHRRELSLGAPPPETLTPYPLSRPLPPPSPGEGNPVGGFLLVSLFSRGGGWRGGGRRGPG